MPLTEAQAEALVEQLADDAALLHGVVHGDAETEVVTEGGTVPSVAKVIATAEDALTGSVALAEAWADKAEDEEVETDKYSARHWAAKAAAIRDSLVNVVEFKGAFDASEGEFPAEPDIGDLYAVTVGGTVSGNVLVSGDEIIYGPSGWIVVGRNLSAGEIVTLLVGNFTDSAHGNRGGGTLHALATTSVAGFMSAADKAYLDGLPAELAGKLDTSGSATATPQLAAISLVESRIVVPRTLVADDNVIFIPAAFLQGRMDLVISGSSGSAFRCSGAFSFRTLPTQFCRKVAVDQGVADPFDVATGALSAGGGADNRVTISVGESPQGVYVSNRSGQTIGVAALLLGAMS